MIHCVSMSRPSLCQLYGNIISSISSFCLKGVSLHFAPQKCAALPHCFRGPQCLFQPAGISNWTLQPPSIKIGHPHTSSRLLWQCGCFDFFFLCLVFYLSFSTVAGFSYFSCLLLQRIQWLPLIQDSSMTSIRLWKWTTLGCSKISSISLIGGILR